MPQRHEKTVLTETGSAPALLASSNDQPTIDFGASAGHDSAADDVVGDLLHMKKFVINMERSTDRLAQFQSMNAHVCNIARFNAIDGLHLSQDDLIAQNKIEADHFYSKGALGNALSHAALWEHCIRLDEPITVVEDDAILSFYFEHHLRQLATFRGHWDYVAWGWNFDMPLWINLMPSVAPFLLQTSQNSLRAHIAAFQKADLDSKLIRLAHSFGALCYSISPRGARRLLDHCLPIRPAMIDFKFFGASSHRNMTVDVIMAGAYLSMQAFVSVPPTAVSENRHETSTVWIDH